MASETNHDSQLQFSIGSLADLEDPARLDVAPRNDLERSMPMIDLSSDAPLPELPEDARLHPPPAYDPPLGRDLSSPAEDRAQGGLWLDGDVLMCGCPDCRAPMSIRLWLMIADCWRCGTSIELTEEQEREAMRLLEERERKLRETAKRSAAASKAKPVPAPPSPAKSAEAPRTASARPSAKVETKSPAPRVPDQRRRPEDRPVVPPTEPARSERTRPAPPAATPRSQPASRFQTGPAATGSAPAAPVRTATRPVAPAAPRRAPAHVAPSPARRRIQEQATASVAHVWIRSLFKDTPAWLVSLVFHLVALTLLAMLGPEDDRGPHITLSVVLSDAQREGGDKVIIDPTDDLQFDLPIPDQIDMENPEQREALVRADQDARELRIDPDTTDPQMPELSKVKQVIGTPSSVHAALAARDPRVRVEMIQKEGGTTHTEAAVARALRWLAEQQRPDGHWKLDGRLQSDMGATSLAMLPFLGAGQSHTTGRYRDVVSKGLRWMVDHQKPDGDLRYNCGGNSGMYAHGQGAIVLCEAFLMSGDEELRVPAQRAIDFIVKAQHVGGGWRYTPNAPGDTSVVGWQLMALQSARAANLTVPDATFELSGHFLDTVQSHGGSRYAYMPRYAPTHVMTAEALLCRIYLGWTKENPGLVQGVDYLLDNHMPASHSPNIYYWYYATQTMHHVGGEEWERWNLQMRDILVNSQVTSGKNAGSWDPRGAHSAEGGRLYMTALATCSLEVYYRHLPIFRQIKLD